MGTSHSGAMTSTVLVLMGQLGIAIVLDYVFFGEFSFANVPRHSPAFTFTILLIVFKKPLATAVI